MPEPVTDSSFSGRVLRRRTFFRVAGATAAASALVLAGCSPDDNTTPTPVTPVFGLGGGDVGVLNYAYLLEQLEAAFYQKVLDTPPADLKPGELEYFTDLRDHEVIHREFLKFALADKAFDVSLGTALTFDFSSLTLTSRAGVLAAAKTFEDLGVAAYNGAGKLIADKAYLIILGKIASVEARHAALVRDLLQPNSFADVDVVAATDNATTGAIAGLDRAISPADVLTAVAPFLTIQVSGAGLPIS